MKTSMKNTKFESCNFSLATAEEAISESAEFNKCDFSQADFIESNFKDAVFNAYKFDSISIENSLLLGTQFISLLILKRKSPYRAFSAFRNQNYSISKKEIIGPIGEKRKIGILLLFYYFENLIKT